MLNSLIYEAAHTKDSLKQKRHYFWKQGQEALVGCSGQRRRKVEQHKSFEVTVKRRPMVVHGVGLRFGVNLGGG